MGFPGSTSGKKPPTNTGDVSDAGLTPRLGSSPGVGHGNPSTILAGETHGRRSLASYSPWGHKESDMTEVT